MILRSVKLNPGSYDVIPRHGSHSDNLRLKPDQTPDPADPVTTWLHLFLIEQGGLVKGVRLSGDISQLL